MKNLIILSATTGIFIASLGVLFFSKKDSQPATAGSCLFEPAMILIEGGTFTMGAGGLYPDEDPAHERTVNSFYISRYEVTNGEFAEFVDATGYVTVAERQPDSALYPNIPKEQLKPGSAVFVKLDEAVQAATFLNWWHFIEGAYWRQPNGPRSSIEGMKNYPVIHIALEDAQAYAKWKGHRLPSEAEFEFASRGGLRDAKYARGDSLTIKGEYTANTWQGLFPFSNSLEDGYEGLAPVGCYKGNGYGVHDMIGNVWEWTQTPYFPTNHPLAATQYKRYASQYGFDANQPGVAVGVIKGGSYLCAEDFCARYRPAARHAQGYRPGHQPYWV